MFQSVSKNPGKQRRMFYRFCVNKHTPLSGRTRLCTLALPLLLRTVTVHAAGEKGDTDIKLTDRSTSVSASGNTMVASEETKLLIRKEELVPHQWVGMPIEQLLNYSKDPFWVRLRQFCFGLYWCAFSILCIFVLVLIVTAPRCQPTEWWQEGPMYGVFAHDFRNGNTSDENRLSGR